MDGIGETLTRLKNGEYSADHQRLSLNESGLVISGTSNNNKNTNRNGKLQVLNL